MIRPLPAVPTWLPSLLIPFKSIFPLLGEFPKTKFSVIAKTEKTATQVLQLSHSRSYSDRNSSAWIREGLHGTDRENLPREANRNILNPSAVYCSSKTCIIKGERKGRRNKSSGVDLIVMDSKQWSITATWNSFLFWLHWLKRWNTISCV